MSDKRLEKAWAEWSAVALPQHAPLQQRASMRTAFMCGAACVLSAVMRENSSEEETQEYIKSVSRELLQFMAVLHEGMRIRVAHEAALATKTNGGH